MKLRLLSLATSALAFFGRGGLAPSEELTVLAAIVCLWLSRGGERS